MAFILFGVFAERDLVRFMLVKRQNTVKVKGKRQLKECLKRCSHNSYENSYNEENPSLI